MKIIPVTYCFKCIAVFRGNLSLLLYNNRISSAAEWTATEWTAEIKKPWPGLQWLKLPRFWAAPAVLKCHRWSPGLDMLISFVLINLHIRIACYIWRIFAYNFMLSDEIFIERIIYILVIEILICFFFFWWNLLSVVRSVGMEWVLSSLHSPVALSSACY